MNCRPSQIHPGLIINHRRFRFEGDPTSGKRRPCLVLDGQRGELLVRGIFTRPRNGRAAITRVDAPCLDHDSFLDSSIVLCRLSDVVAVLGDTAPWFDPFDDFAHV